jgi:hypothetical protein
MIDYDLSRHPGRPSEWAALVAAIHASTESEENYWLELKSTLDWSKPHGVGTLARAIIGLANRDPERAAPFLGGSGVVIVGLGPGEVFPIEVLDNADLDNKLSSYLGEDGPRWRPEWIKVAGQTVLLVEVDAPRNGDPQYTLRASFGQYGISQTFVREIGKTVLASEADVRRLARRYLATDDPESLDVTLGVSLDEPLSTYFWEDDAIETFLAGEEARLLKSLADVEAERAREAAAKAAEEKAAREAAAARPIDYFSTRESLMRDAYLSSGLPEFSKRLEAQSRIFAGGLTETHEEDRTPEAFKVEVARYIKGVRAAMPEALWTVTKRIVPMPTFWLTNLAQRNYTAVEVTIWVEGEAKAESNEYDDEVKIRPMLPTRPRKYGPWTSATALGSLLASQGLSNYSSVMPPLNYGPPSAGRREIQNGGSFRARFDPINLRPGDVEVEVESDLVILVPRDRVEPVVVRWEATASNVDATARGDFVLPFEGEPIDVLKAGL